MRHLLCEHQNTICELNADRLVSEEAVQEEQKKLETKLGNEVASLLVDLHQVDIETPIMELKKVGTKVIHLFLHLTFLLTLFCYRNIKKKWQILKQFQKRNSTVNCHILNLIFLKQMIQKFFLTRC